MRLSRLASGDARVAARLGPLTTAGHLMEDEFPVECPYCGAHVEIYLERDVGGTLVQDCEVCCNPWTVIVSSRGGERHVEVRRADGADS